MPSGGVVVAVGVVVPVEVASLTVTIEMPLHELVAPLPSIARTCQNQVPGVVLAVDTLVEARSPEETVEEAKLPSGFVVEAFESSNRYVTGVEDEVTAPQLAVCHASGVKVDPSAGMSPVGALKVEAKASGASNTPAATAPAIAVATFVFSCICVKGLLLMQRLYSLVLP